MDYGQIQYISKVLGARYQTVTHGTTLFRQENTESGNIQIKTGTGKWKHKQYKKYNKIFQKKSFKVNHGYIISIGLKKW